MLTTQYTLSGISIGDSDAITQITDKDIGLGLEDVLSTASGSPDTEFAGVMTGKPLVSFTTTALAKALTLIGLAPMALTSGNTAVLYFRPIAQGGVRTDTACLPVTIANGLIVPKTIDAQSKGKPASISYDIHAISADGSTCPFVVGTATTLPAFDTISEQFTIGPVKYTPTSGSSTPLPANTGFRFDFGVKMADVVHAEGLPWPTFAGVTNRQPRIKVDGVDMSRFTTTNLGGVSLSSWTTFLRKLAPGATRVLDVTAQHIKISGTVAMLRHDSARVSDGKAYESGWYIHPVFDGTNDIFSTNTASAVS